MNDYDDCNNYDEQDEPRELLDPARVVTLAEGARLCGCSINTLKRRNTTGRLPNAHQDLSDGHRPWLVPIADLVAAGLLDPDEVKRVSVLAATTESREADIVALRNRVAVLTAELAARQDDIAFLRTLVAACWASSQPTN